jgi:hypothetical protein
MEQMRQSQTDARNQASYDATIGAGSEASRMQGMDLSSGQFANSAAQQALQQQLAIGSQKYGQNMQSSNYQNQLRQQQIAEEMQKRGFSLNEINALLSGQQVAAPQMPSFMGAERAEAAPVYQGAVDQGNWDQAANQQMTDAMTGLAGSAMMFSDRRLKRNIRRTGTVKGYPWYEFEYVWGDKAEGFMSDEIPQKYVSKLAGYDVVNIGEMLR